MRSLIWACVAFLGGMLQPTVANAQTYQLTGKSYEMSWPTRDWNGRHGFRNVYCVEFPSPQSADRLVHAMFNNSSIYLTTVMYPDNVHLAIAVSTVPSGRSADEEIARMAENERKTEKAYNTNYNITQFSTDFGPTIGLRIKDVAAGSKNGPFPLERAMYTSPKGPITTLSVHRLFVRGLDRFEVAAIQLASQPATDNTEAEMTVRLTNLTDELVKSLQNCTKQMPLRTSK